MSTVPVAWWSNLLDVNPRDQWDTGILQRLFNGDLGPIRFDFEHWFGFEPREFGPAVVVVSARHHTSSEDIAALNAALAVLPGVVLVLASDEEGVFPWRKIVHGNIRFWVMSPHPKAHGDMAQWAYFFGTGYRSDTPDILSGFEPSKDLDWYFAGQNTHPRRRQAVDGLRKAMERTNGHLIPTEGFTKGQERSEYLRELARAKIAPCPSGPFTADTMRLYEALEAGCYPIIDSGPIGMHRSTFDFRAMCPPCQEVSDWDGVGGHIEDALKVWPQNANAVGAWWEQTKRAMVKRMESDLIAVGAKPRDPRPEELVTAVITVSPSPLHPDSEMLIETIESVSASFGEAGLDRPRIVLAFDGVRKEQAEMAPAYHEHVRRMVDWCRRLSGGLATPVISREHWHQAAMTRYALAFVDTPLILFMEQDTPLSSELIDWKACIEMMEFGALDVLRFSHEAQVHPEHAHMNIGPVTEIMGVPVQPTRQYSARPHLAQKAWYDRVLAEHFTLKGKSFIEDRLYGMCLSEPVARNRIALYHPEGSIRRSLHTDGRRGEPKWAELQEW